jgi:uncharacterized protein (TIGR03000 family)
MSCCVLSLKRSSLAWAALLVAGSPVWAQSVGYPYPYSGYSFGSTFYPYWGSAPSSYGGAPLPYQGSGAPLRPLTGSLYSPQLFVPGYSLEGPLGTGSILLPGNNYTPRPDNRAHIWLRVPADAEVWFEGNKTKQTGTQRYFFSPPLAGGKKYSYQVQVRWSKDGKPAERKQQIDVRAGDSLRLDLTGKPAPKNSAVPEAEESTLPQAGK